MKKIYLMLLLACLFLGGYAQETIFCDYFDIPLCSAAGTEVLGKVHLERNKDVRKLPIPKGYRFVIDKQDADALFTIDTRYDPAGRIMGVLSVAKGKNTGKRESVKKLTLSLNDGMKKLQQVDVEVRLVKKTLWSTLYERSLSLALENSRMFGKKMSDAKIEEMLAYLELHDWKFPDVRMYDAHPSDYLNMEIKNVQHKRRGLLKTIDAEWEHVAMQLGSMGHAYETSKVFGKKGDPAAHSRLGKALMNAMLAYVSAVPVEGDDLLVGGKPLGDCTGDGFIRMAEHKWMGRQMSTHQWVAIDPVGLPAVSLMPEIMDGMQKGDSLSTRLYYALVRFYQNFFAEIESRRAIDQPNGRWGELRDTINSAGAWADANLGHRLRTLLVLPVVWADYNRPVTYVQYWYKNYFKNRPFDGFSYANGWSPRGVVSDVAHWMTRFDVEAHFYGQSGYMPDGTVSHHVAHATDAALVAYGFGWLTGRNRGLGYFKDTPFRIPVKHYQFELDRLLKVYPKLFYKQTMDFLVGGRAYKSDMRRFVMRDYMEAVSSLGEACSADTRLEGYDKLKEVAEEISTGKYEYSGSDAYWIQEYLVHRRGEHEQPFIASLKLKSRRTVGAEDFEKVKKSWHMGSGILNIRVHGNEYDEGVMGNMDWHALPGLTEEWRTDPFPVKGGSQASLPGRNAVSGVLADGMNGMAIYHHFPKETYSSATALKSYFFVNDKIIGLGSHVKRVRSGQGKSICTFLEQSRFTGKILYSIAGKKGCVLAKESVDLQLPLSGQEVAWVHTGDKGYVILPRAKQLLILKTGKNIFPTDKKGSSRRPNFIIALSHGTNPAAADKDAFVYVVVPNAQPAEMDKVAARIQKEVVYGCGSHVAHTLYSPAERMWQFAFFEAGTAETGGVSAKAEQPALLMLQQQEGKWRLSVSNPVADAGLKVMKFFLSQPLPEGEYTYEVGGMKPMQGERVLVKRIDGQTEVTVELPDDSDQERYFHQAELYAGLPVTVNL